MRKIIYIAGTARTGSTIMDILLGSTPETCSVGQLADLHHSRSCACGESIEECELWGQVLSHPDVPDLEDLGRLGRLTRKEVGLPLFLASRGLCRRYAEAYDRIYDAIFEARPDATLIDSSKNMARAFGLLRSSRHDVRILHVIRDPRGFGNSIRRQQERGGKRRVPAPLVMTHWLLKQATASILLARTAKHYVRIRYEDLMLDPFSTLDRIGDFAEVDVQSIKERIRNEEPFSSGHIFSGNRVSRNKEIVFDSDRIETNRLTSMSRNRFWYTIGWPSAFWGYDREQSYLPRERDTE